MIEVKDIEFLASKKEDENWRFRRYLKNYANVEKLDKQFKMLHNKYFKIYDCTKCRNCCKKLGISMTEIELDNICSKLKIDKKEFIRKNLNDNYGEYSSKTKPCLFLDTKTNKCKIENCKASSCIDYPYTDKEDRLFSLIGVVNNAKVCPVVYEILEELKEMYNFY